MTVYKVTYLVKGDATYRDVNVTSVNPLTEADPLVMDAARRDSVNYPPAPSSSSLVGITIVSVTKV